MGGDTQTQRVERVSNVAEESRSFYDEEDGEDDDQDGDEDPLPTKANAGSPGSGGSAATPAESLRNDGSCPQLAEASHSDVSM